MNIKAFFDSRTSTLTYVVFDPMSRDAVIIDPVLDYDPAASRIWSESVDAVIEWAASERLQVAYVLETHAHADHLSGAQRLKQACPNLKIAIGANIVQVQKTFQGVFGLGPEFPADGSQFDRLLEDGRTYEVGKLRVEVIATPGHTPACCSYKIGDAVFTGDALFMPDSGTGRCDFPGGSASDLYDSVARKLYSLPDATRVFVGHDYQPGGRALAYESTIGQQKESNIALKATTTQQQYVQMRTERDATLRAPQLMLHSVQVNINAGKLPAPEDNGLSYLRLPINAFKAQPLLPPSRICADIREPSTQN